MKAIIVIVKKQRKCSYCSSIISKGEKLIETIEWIPTQTFPKKENICFECIKVRTVLISTIENLLNDLKILKKKEDEVIF